MFLSSYSAQNQRGMVLLLSLMMLFLLTLLSLSSLRSADFQQRMANALWSRSLAFQAAESGLLEAEIFLQQVIRLDAFLDQDFSDGLYTAAAAGEPEVWETLDWQGSQLRLSSAEIPGQSAPPRYIIEYLETVCVDARLVNPCPANNLFRVTSVGTGVTPAVQVALQSVYACPENQPCLAQNSRRLAWQELADTGFLF